MRCNLIGRCLHAASCKLPSILHEEEPGEVACSESCSSPDCADKSNTYAGLPSLHLRQAEKRTFLVFGAERVQGLPTRSASLQPELKASGIKDLMRLFEESFFCRRTSCSCLSCTQSLCSCDCKPDVVRIRPLLESIQDDTSLLFTQPRHRIAYGTANVSAYRLLNTMKGWCSKSLKGRTIAAHKPFTSNACCFCKKL